MAVHVLYLICAVAVGVLLRDLFRRAQPTLPLLALAINLVGIAIEAAGLLALQVPLTVLSEGSRALAALGEGPRQAIAYLAVRQFSSGFGFSLVFFAGFCVCTGALIIRSRLFPRLIGALMVLAGVRYLVNSLALIMAPDLESRLFPWILLPAFVAELSFALWLTVIGVDAKAWRAQVAAS